MMHKCCDGIFQILNKAIVFKKKDTPVTPSYKNVTTRNMKKAYSKNSLNTPSTSPPNSETKAASIFRTTTQHYFADLKPKTLAHYLQEDPVTSLLMQPTQETFGLFSDVESNSSEIEVQQLSKNNNLNRRNSLDINPYKLPNDLELKLKCLDRKNPKTTISTRRPPTQQREEDANRSSDLKAVCNDILKNLKDTGSLDTILALHKPSKIDQINYRSPHYKMNARGKFCEKVAKSHPFSVLIDIICKFIGGQAALELYSGTGFLAKLLDLREIKIFATDTYPSNCKQTWLYYKVKTQDAVAAVKTHSNAGVLIINWHANKRSDAADALLEFKGDKLVCIGESGTSFFGLKRCCADDRFFEILERDWDKDSNWEKQKKEDSTVDILKCLGMGESLYFFTRK